MKTSIFAFASAFLCGATASIIPYGQHHSHTHLKPRASCENSATSRNCWGDYSIDTNFYDETPVTNVTREYWLSVEYANISPDGYLRRALTFNGTVPGPAIIADWGDNLVIHVTNNLPDNGTAIHWHGIRQLGSLEYDGVPGVTQCPIAPGDSLTYKFQATQYGSTWYHSHFTLQYGDGLLGPLIINGPATADYDEDLGMLFLSDWAHKSAFELWYTARKGAPPTLENTLINGTNTYDCTGSTDTACVGGGVKYQQVFEAGKKYRFRLVNTALDAHFRFSIDNHTMTVIANDLVPIVPYTTDNLLVSIGQRYDVIVEADQGSGDFWLRGGWQTACSSNSNADDMTGIIRYDSSSTEDPTSTTTALVSSCSDEDVSNLVPYLALDVGSTEGAKSIDLAFVFGSTFTWTINTTSLVLDWSDPTTLQIFNNVSIFPTDYNVFPVETTIGDPNWAVYIIQDLSGIGVTHPIHLHGHDFWVLAQTTGVYDASTAVINLTNPPRRDVASLPGNGYLIIAFKKDNPGSWLMHCHIAWHASEGLAMQFVESESQIAVGLNDTAIFQETCNNWNSFTAYTQDDSGI